MEKIDILNCINENGCGKYVIILKNGTRVDKRLFVTSEGYLCEFKKGSSSRGHLLNMDINSIKEMILFDEFGKEEKIKRFLKNVVKYLTASGLWENIRVDFQKILDSGDEIIKQIADKKSDEYAVLKSIGLKPHVDCLLHSALLGIKCINYESYEKDEIREAFAEAIKNKTHYSHCWQKGYDNSISCEISDKDTIIRGYYSEEYRGCGNGHYYLALDEKHAIYCEKD